MSEITLKDLLKGKKWKEFITHIFADKDEDTFESVWQKAIEEQTKELKEYHKETESTLRKIDEMTSEEVFKFIAKTLYKMSRKL